MPLRRGRGRRSPPQARGVDLGEIDEARPDRLVVRPHQRIGALQIDVVLDQHQRPRPELGPQRARGVGQQERPAADRLQRAHQRVERPGTDALVEMRPAPTGRRPARRRAGRAPAARHGPARSAAESPAGRRRRSVDRLGDPLGDAHRGRSPGRSRPAAAGRAARRRITRGRILGRRGAAPPRLIGPNAMGSRAPRVVVSRSPSGPAKMHRGLRPPELGEPLAAAAAGGAQQRRRCRPARTRRSPARLRPPSSRSRWPRRTGPADRRRSRRCSRRRPARRARGSRRRRRSPNRARRRARAPAAAAATSSAALTRRPAPATTPSRGAASTANGQSSGSSSRSRDRRSRARVATARSLRPQLERVLKPRRPSEPSSICDAAQARAARSRAPADLAALARCDASNLPTSVRGSVRPVASSCSFRQVGDRPATSRLVTRAGQLLTPTLANLARPDARALQRQIAPAAPPARRSSASLRLGPAVRSRARTAWSGRGAHGGSLARAADAITAP